jgi:Ni,Fe-hydrogenase III small subunit
VITNGDGDLSGTLTAADIILLVNYIFKAGPEPQPCVAVGDINCDGKVTSADIILLVNHVFKSMAPPCDIDQLIPGIWQCP